MKHFGIFLVLAMGLPSSDYHVSYIEKQNGITRHVTARVQNQDIFIDKLEGTFPKDMRTAPPWYLKGLPPLEENVTMEIEDLPALPLKRKFEKQKEELFLGKKIIHYRVTLEMKAKSEILPLNDEEAAQNALLNPFGIQEVRLEGDGNAWFDPEKKINVTEEFVLKGQIVKNGKPSPLSIDWAKGLSLRGPKGAVAIP
ncbi:MAG: hypothetical protein Q7T03_03745 [Deltaproteobacteria bacterium]|nr:hypothetical protein [Deltaproteobacteria bacterium]